MLLEVVTGTPIHLSNLSGIEFLDISLFGTAHNCIRHGSKGGMAAEY